MSNITSKVSEQIPNNERSQYWNTQVHTNDNNTAIAAGDVFQVEDSLGKVAKSMVITTTTSSVSIRRNIESTLFHPIDPNLYGIPYDFLNSGISFTKGDVNHPSDSTMHPTIVEANSVYTYDGTIKTIEIVTMSGNFSLEVA